MPNDPRKTNQFEEMASSFPFDLDDGTVEECLSIADSLRTTAEGLYRPVESDTTDRPHERSDDEYGALLHVYERPRSESSSGPLAGRSVAVKDNLAARGLPMTCGSETLSFTPPYDAVVVERLLDAGADVIGKANMDAFALGPTGEFSELVTVRNPIDEDRIPGGTSSGSAVAVAAELVDVALGTDTGGSIRIPAACCGVVGVKPTHGIVPRHGLVEFAPSLDTIGPLTRDVETATITLDAVAGYDRRDPSSKPIHGESLTGGNPNEPDRLSIGLVDSFFHRSDTVVTDAIRDTMADLDAQTDITITTVDVELGDVEDAYFLIGATEFTWLLRQDGITRGQGTGYEESWRRSFAELTECTLSEHIGKRLLPSAWLDEQSNGRAYLAARQEAIEFGRRLDATFEEVDLLVTPTIRTLPPERDRIDASGGMLDVLGNTAPFNLAGTPAVSLPVAERGGLLVSAQIVAPPFADARMLRGARVIESFVNGV